VESLAVFDFESFREYEKATGAGKISDLSPTDLRKYLDYFVEAETELSESDRRHSVAVDRIEGLSREDNFQRSKKQGEQTRRIALAALWISAAALLLQAAGVFLPYLSNKQPPTALPGLSTAAPSPSHSTNQLSTPQVSREPTALHLRA
jgi:hypothetical protein